jgi:hypothetical protein
MHYGNDYVGPVPTIDLAEPEPYWVVSAWNGISEKKVESAFNAAIAGDASDTTEIRKVRAYAAVVTLNLATYVKEEDVLHGWEHCLGPTASTATLEHFRIIVALIALVLTDLHRWRRPEDDTVDPLRLDTATWPFHPQWKVTPIDGTMQVSPREGDTLSLYTCIDCH